MTGLEDKRALTIFFGYSNHLRQVKGRNRYNYSKDSGVLYGRQPRSSAQAPSLTELHGKRILTTKTAKETTKVMKILEERNSRKTGGASFFFPRGRSCSNTREHLARGFRIPISQYLCRPAYFSRCKTRLSNHEKRIMLRRI
jgi:hypothetical protein